MTNVLATIAFIAVVVGLWLVYAPLALIIPGVFILACLIYDKLRGRTNA